MKGKGIYLFLVLFGISCTGVSTITKEDLSFMYDRNLTKLRLPTRVYNVDSNAAELHFKLRTTDLLYRRGGQGDPFASLVKVRFDTYDATDRKLLLDSAQVFVTDLTEDPLEEKELYGVLPMKRFPDRSVLVIISAHDLYRDIQSIRRREIGPSGVADLADFMMLDPERQVPYLSDQLDEPRSIEVRADRFKGQTLQGSFRRSDLSIAPPVFSTRGVPPIPEESDSLFTITIGTDGVGSLQLKRKGIYHIRPVGYESGGYPISVLGSSYPKVSDVDDMIPPLRYITSKEEFERIRGSKQPRAEVEKLWKDLSGNRERARQVIRAYYNRVENANLHFTSHKEGWRTDRGLVHIIFGIPNTIHKNSDSETWIYGEESSLMSMAFVFVKQTNPFSDNDLRLQRDPSFKSAWYRNVESWRNGRVYEQ